MEKIEQDPKQKNWVLYFYKKDEEKARTNAVAVFIYDDKITNIYPRPDGDLYSGLTSYKEKIQTGQVKHDDWQQFNYLTRGAFPPNCDIFELDDKRRSEVAKLLSDWNGI